MEAWLLEVVSTINGFLADYLLIILLVGVGIWYTVKTKCVQVRCFGQGMKNVFGSISLNGKKEKSGMSSFQAFATAVAGQVGTGNIIGASGAILRSFWKAENGFTSSPRAQCGIFTQI